MIGACQIRWRQYVRVALHAADCRLIDRKGKSACCTCVSMEETRDIFGSIARPAGTTVKSSVVVNLMSITQYALRVRLCRPSP